MPLKKHLRSRTNQLREFHHFPQLPIELSLNIWHLAVDSPRIVHLNFIHSSLAWTAKASAALSILSVNQGARSEALKYYDQPFNLNSILTLPASKNPNGSGPHTIGDLHFRWDQDLIYIDLPGGGLPHQIGRGSYYLSFGEIFNTAPKESIIEKGLLKKFAIHGMGSSSLKRIKKAVEGNSLGSLDPQCVTGSYFNACFCNLRDCATRRVE